MILQGDLDAGDTAAPTLLAIHRGEDGGTVPLDGLTVFDYDRACEIVN